MAAGTTGQGHDRHGRQRSLAGRFEMPAAREGKGHPRYPRLPGLHAYRANTVNAGFRRCSDLANDLTYSKMTVALMSLHL